MRSLPYYNYYLPTGMAFVTLIVSLLFLLVYLGPILLIFHNPYSYHFSHGILILGIISYMLWEKKESLKKIPVNPNIVPAIIVLILGSVVLWAGKYTETPVVEGTALVIGVVGLDLLLLGSEHFKALLFPIFYLSFLFHIFDKILVNYSTYFEQTAALLGGQFLKNNQHANGMIYHKTDAAIVIVSFVKENERNILSDEKAAGSFLGDLIPAVQTYMKNSYAGERSPD